MAEEGHRYTVEDFLIFSVFTSSGRIATGPWTPTFVETMRGVAWRKCRVEGRQERAGEPEEGNISRTEVGGYEE